MKKTEAVPGGIAISTQGRDEGRYYLIKEVLPGGYILVCDGNYKKLASPKKKSLKHVRLLPEKVETIAEKFSCGGKVFDSEVYSALKAFNAQGSPEGESADIK
ncbi:MAG TPA: KOW domain-containing RNA-binding protein [Candidatus Coproplasma excrementavium]|nr:KOW domain-containing RNA-binding protein [Candidatus Coproplasma excrementavium]